MSLIEPDVSDTHGRGDLMTAAELTDQAARDRIRTETGSNLFVEAGAGSGKTRSLVDRVTHAGPRRRRSRCATSRR